MNIKLKTLVAAIGLTLVAGQASAAIRLPGDTPGNNGSELFAVVFDTESKASYMKDLGIEFQNFLAQPSVAKGAGVTFPGTMFPFTINNTDAAWAGFLGATDGTPTLRFLVAGADSTGSAVGGNRYMGTGASNPFLSRTNQQVASYGNPAINYLAYNQNRGTHSSLSPVSDNGSSFSIDSEANNFGKAGVMTTSWGGAASGNLSGALGESLNFYFTQRSSTSNTALALTDQYDNLVGPATWSLAKNGNDYSLTFAAPVPEPESWALMLAGMALIGGIARRRAK